MTPFPHHFFLLEHLRDVHLPIKALCHLASIGLEQINNAIAPSALKSHRSRINKVWPIGQIGPVTWFCNKSLIGIQLYPFIYVTNVLSMTVCLQAGWCSCSRNHPAPKTQNIYYLALYIESLMTFNLSEINYIWVIFIGFPQNENV